jgi:hypothetical protein
MSCYSISYHSISYTVTTLLAVFLVTRRLFGPPFIIKPLALLLLSILPFFGPSLLSLSLLGLPVSITYQELRALLARSNTLKIVYIVTYNTRYTSRRDLYRSRVPTLVSYTDEEVTAVYKAVLKT